MEPLPSNGCKSEDTLKFYAGIPGTAAPWANACLKPTNGAFCREPAEYQLEHLRHWCSAVKAWLNLNVKLLISLGIALERIDGRACLRPAVCWSRDSLTLRAADGADPGVHTEYGRPRRPAVSTLGAALSLQQGFLTFFGDTIVVTWGYDMLLTSVSALDSILAWHRTTLLG